MNAMGRRSICLGEGVARRRRGNILGLSRYVALIALFFAAVPIFSSRPTMAQSGSTQLAKPVPKAHCGPQDRTETGLQGQTTNAERFSGASEKAYNCNLELVGQVGAGSGFDLADFDNCAYYPPS